MSYKDEIKKEIQHILKDKALATTILYTYIRNLYEKAIYESKKTGQSIESITYEILEGLEESYEAYPEGLEDVLNKCSMIMIDVVHVSALNSIEKKNQKILQAKAELIETLETEKSYLLEALYTFKDYAEDNTHSNFQKSLHQTESDIIERIYALAEHIKYYTNNR